jgi:5-methylcytosine-specific restriction endonuclease McrA
MRRAIREEVARRAENICEYCGWPDWFSPVTFPVEHIIPITLGGTDMLDNLAYSCPGCNGYKHDDIEARDPISGEKARFYHPRADDWEEHFAWNLDGLTIVGISPTGRASVSRLRLNRSEVLRMRQVLPLIPPP